MFTFCHAKSVLYKNTLDFVSFFNLWLEAKLISSWSFVSRNEESIPETKVEEPGGEGICVVWEIDVFFFLGGILNMYIFMDLHMICRWLLGWSLLQNPPKAPHQWHWSLVSGIRTHLARRFRPARKAKAAKAWRSGFSGGRPGHTRAIFTKWHQIWRWKMPDDIKNDTNSGQKLNFSQNLTGWSSRWWILRPSWEARMKS